jgi:hypothetical protein
MSPHRFMCESLVFGFYTDTQSYTGATCSGTLMSYALNSKAADHRQRAIDYNHFFISNPHNLLACHDFEWQVRGSLWLPSVSLWKNVCVCTAVHIMQTHMLCSNLPSVTDPVLGRDIRTTMVLSKHHLFTMEISLPDTPSHA